MEETRCIPHHRGKIGFLSYRYTHPCNYGLLPYCQIVELVSFLWRGVGVMRAISFLGTGSYETVTYTWRGKTWETHLFPEALVKFFEVDALFVLVTPQVKSHPNFLELCNRLGKLVHPLEIPEGKSEEELWQIFDRCVEVVDEHDEILLDITHAFRSIPLIVFTVAAYLRRTRNVTVRHIVYGALVEKGVANVLDLVPLLELLDWLTGAEFLLRRGDAALLAEQIETVHERLWRGHGGGEVPRKLQSLSGKLTSLSLALYFAHPRSVMQDASRLKKMFDVVTPEVQRWAKPFGVILTRVREALDRLAHNAPDCLDAENLRKQFALIVYLLEKGLTPQAVLLAREWVVSYCILARGNGDWLDRGTRLKVEEVLWKAIQAYCRKEDVDVPDWFAAIPGARDIAGIWDELSELRNKIAHCSLYKGSQDAESLERQANKVLARLQVLLDGVPLSSLRGNRVTIDLQSLYEGTAKLEDLPMYISRIQELAGEGKEVVLTGQAPVWLYLSVAHALHGKARRLLYASPVTGETVIFDHSPE